TEQFGQVLLGNLQSLVTAHDLVGEN
ncbi:unnamed protein product, partial [Oikopleura dioica]